MVHRCVARLTKSADVLHNGTMGLSAVLSETFRGQIFAGTGASTLILWLNDRLYWNSPWPFIIIDNDDIFFNI